MKLLAALFSLMILASGCTEKGEPYQKQERALKAPVEQPANADESERISPGSAAADVKTQFSSSANPVPSVLLPFAQRVLELKRVTDPKSMGNRPVLNELIMLNDLILHTTPEQRRLPEFSAVLSLYQSALTKDCGTYRDSCTGVRYLKQAGTSAEVVKLLAKSNTATQFKLLLFALEMKNRLWDGDMIFMLENAPHAGLSASEAEAVTSERHLLVTAMQQLQDKTADPLAARRFLDSINAWEMVEFDIHNTASGLDSSTVEAMLETFGRANYLYAADGSLHPGLKKLIERREQAPDGYMAQQRMLQGKKMYHPDLIGARFTEHLDELTYIIDSVYLGRISPQAGAQLFGSTKKSAVDLRHAVEGFFRLQFALAVYTSAEAAKNVFHSEVEIKSKLSYVTEHSIGVARIWSYFRAQIQPLRSFSQLAAGKRPAETMEAAQLMDLFNSSEKSILMASTYPQTMVLLHMLSQEKFEVAHLGSLDFFDSGDLMSVLFTGHVPPLFPYSEEKNPLNSFQILHAFDFALRTNTFEIYGIDQDFFIADTIRRISVRTVSNINSHIHDVLAMLSQDDTLPRLHEACLEFTEKPQFIPRKFYVGELSLSPYYGSLLELTMLQVHSGGNKNGVMFFDSEFAETVEDARLELTTQIRTGEALIVAYTDYLRKTGASEATVAAKTLASRRVIASLKAKQTEVLTRARGWYNDIGKCSYKMIARDQEVQLKTISMEKAYLRQVYRDITRMRQGPLDPSERQKILARIQFSGLPSGFAGYDRISSDGYTYSQVNYILRMASFLTKGLVTDEGTLPAIAPHLMIDYGPALNFDTDLIYSDHGHGKANQPAYFIPYINSEEEFVNTGLKVVFNTSATNSLFNNWSTKVHGYFVPSRYYEHNLAVLSRLERMLEGKSTDFSPAAVLKLHAELLKAMSISPEERSLYEMLSFKEKFSQSTYVGIMVEKNRDGAISDLWGIFDFPLKLLLREEFGYAVEKDKPPQEAKFILRQKMSDVGGLYFLSRSTANRGRLILPYSSTLDQHLDETVLKFVRSEIAAADDSSREALDYANQVKTLPEDQRPRADVDMFLTIRDPMVSDSVMPNYRSTLNRFHQDTQNCFASDAACPAFK